MTLSLTLSPLLPLFRSPQRPLSRSVIRVGHRTRFANGTVPKCRGILDTARRECQRQALRRVRNAHRYGLLAPDLWPRHGGAPSAVPWTQDDGPLGERPAERGPVEPADPGRAVDRCSPRRRVGGHQRVGRAKRLAGESSSSHPGRPIKPTLDCTSGDFRGGRKIPFYRAFVAPTMAAIRPVMAIPA